MKIQDTFLLDEVRCSFMVPTAVKQAWAAELEVLAEIDRVCQRHGIQYFADWGTLLGTVRHGGFIPWDDDLDIVMKREDYDKFMKVARFDMEEGFDVQTYRNQKDFWLFMGKVVGKNRFCFEKEHLRRFHNFPYIACVDIFVLDYVYKDPQKEEERRRLCKYMLGVADAIVEGSFGSKEKERSLKTVEEMYGKSIKRMEDPVEMGRYLYGEIEKIFAEVPEQEADSLTQLFPWGLKGNALHFPKEYYEKAVYLPFECTAMPVPVLYDKMLRLRYGDYLKLVKSAGAHNYPFFEGQKENLQKVLDFPLPEFRPEYKRLFRSEEEQGYKMQSYKVMAKECIQELWRMLDGLFAAKTQSHIEQAINLLQESQQLTIDLGTLLEQVLGEGNRMIHLLEQYCEELYLFYESLLQETTNGNEKEIGAQDSLESGFKRLQSAIDKELKENILDRKAVLFLPVFAKDWDGLHTLWQAAANDPKCDTYVVPLPYYFKDYDGSPRKLCCDVAEFPDQIQALDYKLFPPEYLEMLHPEIILIQNPYDAWNPIVSVPESFYSENIRKYTEQLIYVPPFVVEEYTKQNHREYFNMCYYVTMPGVVYADKVLVQSENMKQLYVEKLTEFVGEATSEIWEERVAAFGLPIMDKESVCERKPVARPKKLLYGISLGTYLEDAAAASEKIRKNLQIFKSCEEQVEVTVYIFPKDNSALSDSKNEIVRLLKEQPCVISRQEEVCPTKEYDAYYGDPMPIVTEFGQAKKPVMIQNYSI